MGDGSFMEPGLRGRTRAELEIDVLVAAATVDGFRAWVLDQLQPDDFTLSDHRALFVGLHGLSGDPDDWFARTVGCTVPEALERRMAASPWTYDADAQLLARLSRRPR